MGIIEYIVMALGTIVLGLILGCIFGTLERRNEKLSGVLEINNTNPDVEAYRLVIDKNVDLNSVDEITIRVTHI